ncbi:permease [Paenibacillus sp. sptzw28]|nr:permease [Paenibacillus sp. sptzw28]
MILATWNLPKLDSEFTANFKTIFISILLEALPFMMLGVLFSALLEVFVSEKTVRRFIPDNPLLAIPYACLLGFIFPICECGLTPVIRRLMSKGMPLYVAIVFIIAGPIINPIVLISTIVAFRIQPSIAYYRLGLAFAIAVIIGLFIWRTVKADPRRTAALSAPRPVTVKRMKLAGENRLHQISHALADGPDVREHSHRGSRISSLLSHAIAEFFEMGKYLLFGSILTALVQTLVSRNDLTSLGEGLISSHLFMMGFAYVLSLCSTSDAFVASSFITLFTKGSLLTFMLLGPMLDMKSTIMLLSVFKTRFVLLLAALISITVLLVTIIAEQILPM